MKIVTSFLFILMLFPVCASHIIGGDIYYDYLGGNNYRFYITLYRDCNSTGAEFDNPMKLAVYNNNSLIHNLDVPFPGSTFIPVDFNNPCATAPTGICVEKATYQTVVNLPPAVGGYTITYQRCCRGPNVTNLVNPDDTGITLTTTVPGSETGISVNSSPRFTNYPPILLCNNDELVFNHSATDPDGDDLVYSLVTPFSGGSSFDPAPAQAPPPPYFPVQWMNGFNAQSPLGPGSSVNLDAVGILTVNPSIIGLFVVGVRVQEYRNGVLIGQTVRDFLFRVFDCNITMQAILPTQEELSTFISYCQGLTVQFENNSYGGTNYAWDFGVAGINSDVSTNFSPSYTYPSPGTYTAQLIVNPGWACTDTAYINITVNHPFSLSWSSQDSLCLLDNSFDFILNTNNMSANFEWILDSDASINSWSGNTIPSVSFATPGFHSILINGDDGSCQTSYEDSVFLFDLPEVDIHVPEEVECNGLSVDFDGDYTNVGQFYWNFGNNGQNSDESTLASPSFTYSSPGTYIVQLIASSGPSCSDTAQVEITLNEPLLMQIFHDDSLCITDGLYDFQGLVSGPPTAVFEWDFGDEASVSTSSDLHVLDVQFMSSGIHEIQFTGSYDNCVDSVVSTVYVYGEPSIDFTYVDGLHCAPSLAQFINLSYVDGLAEYSWDFGDGTFSSLENPTHTYTEVGSYSVGLTLISHEGCVDTLYLMQQDVFTVYPSPTAGFAVNPDRIDVCDSEVSFIDESIGAQTYFYFFDQDQFTSSNANFTHSYVNSGTDYPMQVVYNEHGCSDSVRMEVHVEPFAIYAPNSFIPDGDGLNDVFYVVTDFDIVYWELSIYDRWGELVFSENNPSLGWNGEYKGLSCQDGAYAYVLRYKSCANPHTMEMISGFVSLIR